MFAKLGIAINCDALPAKRQSTKINDFRFLWNAIDTRFLNKLEGKQQIYEKSRNSRGP
jgi:hypothetical protein